MTVDAIKEAILGLPEAEKTRLAGWLNTQDSAAWDRQIEADFSDGGPGMALLEKWDEEIKNTEPIPLEEFLNQREKRSRSKY